jgi:hypothetical protein
MSGGSIAATIYIRKHGSNWGNNIVARRDRRLISLLDMVRFSGETFYRLSSFLTFVTALHKGSKESIRSTFTALNLNVPAELSDFSFDILRDLREALKKTIPEYREYLETAGLELSLKTFDRLNTLLDKPDLKFNDLSDLLGDLQQRIEDELAATSLWQVPRDRLKFLGVDLFKLTEPTKFGAAHRDIEEAGKCLAFDRGTASVFHLMRVVECGLRSLCASLNNPDLSPKRNPSWEAILKKCDDELRKPHKDRSSEWRHDDSFFSTATANLRAVKDAWRNPSLHVERDYTPEEAEDVWNAVKAFMRHLAVRLD